MGTRRRTCMLGLALAALAAPSPALAARAAPARPLDRTTSSAHFTIHHQAADDPAYIAAGLADLEESYGRLVAGGGLTPNAGLRVPVNDGDGRTDLYLASPASMPTYQGGLVYQDDTPHGAAYIFMSEKLSRGAFRFRAAHEFMHVIQPAYLFRGTVFIDTGFGSLGESSPNWAAEFALPDIEPGDNRFGFIVHPERIADFTKPWVPFDCIGGTWESDKCDSGYGNWPFLQHLSERFGALFMHEILGRYVDEIYAGGYAGAEIRAMAWAISNHASTLHAEWDRYAARLWDGPGWTTTAIRHLHETTGTPETQFAEVSRSAPDTGEQAVSVDRLATRYLRVRNTGPASATDQLRITVGDPTMASGGGTPVVLVPRADGGRSSTTMTSIGNGRWRATVALDPAARPDVVIPLPNGTTTDNQPFTWQATLLPAGSPAPPAYDTPAGAVTATSGQQVVLDVAGATGRAAGEVPECIEAIDDAQLAARAAQNTRGVWLRFTAPGSGQGTFDTTASDYQTVIALRDAATNGFAGCASGDGWFGTYMITGREYLIYVGRQADARGIGRTMRITVTAPPARPATTPPDTTTPRPPVATRPRTTTPVAPAFSVVDDEPSIAPRVLSLTLPKRPLRLADVLRRGVPVTVRVTRAGRLRVELRLAAAVARRLHLKVARGQSSVRVGLVTESRTRPFGTRTLRVKLTRTAARRLRAARTVRLTVRVSMTGVPAVQGTATIRR